MNHIEIKLDGDAILSLPAARALDFLSAEQLTEALLARLREGALPKANRYKLGEYVPGQGGYFAGDILGDDGVTYGLIVPKVDSDPRAAWGPNGEFDGLSDWDGLSNTNALRDGKHPTADLAAQFEADGHVDFYLPAQRELMVARANVPHLFEKGYYWTSTPYGSSSAWIVRVEYGRVLIHARDCEFRFRPFRRFTY